MAVTQRPATLSPLQRALPRPADAVSGATTATERWTTFAVVTVAGVGLAGWLSFGIQFAVGDALARTYGALVAVQSAHPHLAAIGFIWPPLSTLLQIPLLIVPGMAFYAFSGGVISALFAGLTALLLCQLLARAGLPRPVRWAALVLFFLDPFIAFYAANGMSEMPFVYLFVQSVYCYLRWGDTDNAQWLVGGALTTSVMLLVRYDAAPFSVAFAGAIVAVGVARNWRDRARIEAQVLAFLGPPVLLVGVPWLLANLLITGDALYFLRSEYSNAFLVRDVAAQQELAALRRSPVALARYAIEICLTIAPLLPVTLGAVAALCWLRRSAVLLGLIGLLLVVPAFQLATYLQGQTFGFLRFYITLAPAALIAGAEAVRAVPAGKWRGVAGALLLLGLAITDVTTAAALSRGADKPQGACGWQGNSSAVLVHALRRPTETLNICRDDREMAAFIRERVSTRSVITDVSGNNVVLFSERPELFVLLSDPDFTRIAAEPRGRAGYVLTSRLDTPEFRALEGYFPGLGAGEAEGLTLVHQTGALLLYRIE